MPIISRKFIPLFIGIKAGHEHFFPGIYEKMFFFAKQIDFIIPFQCFNEQFVIVIYC